MPKTYINDGGTWRRMSQIHINDGGTWRNCSEMWVKRAGVWRQTFLIAQQIEINADVNDYDLFTAAGSPATPVEIVLTIGLNVTVGASSIANHALYCSTDLPSGSTLKIINKGTIYGAGGKGGSTNAKNSSFLDYAEDGGPALSLGCNTTLFNSTGYVFGGGGGGGQSTTNYGELYNQNNYAGGGGAGSTPGAGGYVVFEGNTQYAAAGTALAGGNGKIFYGYPAYSFGDTTATKGGGPGATGLIHSTASRTRAGGAAGRAINRNGYTLTIQSGENAAQIKGAYD